ncbi:MAG: deoxyribose-phosphate aldolase [Planctomycetes bacterium]|nr:deoxyribose-phosphate aldolase [Planctomycetota bacterium]
MTEFRRDLASLIDHTLLKPEASRAQVEHLCAEAARYGFASVCINPCWVSLCSRLLEGYTARVCTVIGFPLGASTSQVKAAEAALAVEQGAHEVDMVLNVGALKSAQYAYVQEDVRAVVEAVGRRAVVKVILETCLLSDEEKVLACELARRAGAHFVKTSTGFASGGATLGDVALMRRVVGEGIGVKASGGVRDQRTADLMVMAGATRIGASASVRIVANGKQPA